MSTQFAGQGVTLYLSSGNTVPLEPVWTATGATAAIPNASYSVPIAVNAALKTMLTVDFNSAPGVATDIEYSNTPTFTQSFVLDTLPISSDTLAVFVQSEPLQGFLRVRNTSGVTIDSVVAQQVVSTSWS